MVHMGWATLGLFNLSWFASVQHGTGKDVLDPQMCHVVFVEPSELNFTTRGDSGDLLSLEDATWRQRGVAKRKTGKT